MRWRVSLSTRASAAIWRPLCGCLLCLLLLSLGAQVALAQDRVVRGVVQDSAASSPLEAATVAQLQYGLVVASTASASDGAFELRLVGRGPYDLVIEAPGYSPAHLLLGGRDTLAGPLEIKLARVFELDGLEVSAKRRPLEVRFYSSGWMYTEHGMLSTSEDRSKCRFVVLTGIVLRDPRLFLPEVKSNHWPAQLFDSRRGFGGCGLYHPDALGHPPFDSRLIADAWPCKPVYTMYPGFKRADIGRVDIPLPFPGECGHIKIPDERRPAPDAARGQLVAGQRYQLQLPAPGGLSTSASGATLPAALGPSGRVALAAPGSSVVEVLSPGGEGARRELERIDLSPPPVSLGPVTHLGWLGDTLWVAAAEQGRVVFLAPGTEPLVHDFQGDARLARVWTTGVEAAHNDRYDPDLKVALPLSGGRWLSVQPAPAEPYSPRLQEEPARRGLVLLGRSGRLERILTILQPGPWRIDLDGTPGTPIEPFRDHPLYALDPEGEHITIVGRSFEVAVWLNIYTLTRIGLAGDTIFHVEREAPLLPLAEAALKASAKAAAAEPSLRSIFGVGPTATLLIEKLLYRPPYHPPVTRLVVGRDGSTWLRWPDEGKPTVRWDVVDGAGRPLRTLELDSALELIGADAESAYGILPTPSGTANLVRYSVVGSR